MKKLEMTPLQTGAKLKGKPVTLYLPGGWEAIVPQVKADDTTRRAFARYLRNEGLTEWDAEQEADATIQKLFESAYIRGVRAMLYRRMKEYAEQYPDLVTDDGKLKGFSPERLQSAYFPYERSGRVGKTFIDTLFAEMAKEGRAALEEEAT